MKIIYRMFTKRLHPAVFQLCGRCNSAWPTEGASTPRIKKEWLRISDTVLELNPLCMTSLTTATSFMLKYRDYPTVSGFLDETNQNEIQVGVAIPLV